MTLRTRFLPQTCVGLALVAVLALIGGCTTAAHSSVRLEPQAADGQKISFKRGQPQIKTGGSNPVQLTLVDHANDQMILHVSVSNRGSNEYLFSERDLSGEMFIREGALPVTVYSYEEVLQELDRSDELLAARAGSAAASVGSRAVPYGGAVASVAEAVMDVSTKEGREADARLDARTKAALNDAYIRPNTMTPRSRYEGILRVALPAPLSECESLQFHVRAGTDLHSFVFACAMPGG